MASSLPFSSPHLQLNPSPKPRRSSPSRSLRRPVVASVSEKPTDVPAPRVAQNKKLPIRRIPGDYGLPLVGPFKDRLDYFYNQGREEYFKSKMQKYKSTVFRANMPPGPLIAPNPHVIVLLDGKSFPILFDNSKVEKKDLFTGTFMPSTELTGGYRVLSYLDPTEPKHAPLKQLLFYLLSSRRDHVIPNFTSSYNQLFQSLEAELASKGKATFGPANDSAAFNFLARSLFGANPADTQLGNEGPALVSKWVLFQLAPILTLGLPKYLEDLTLHNFRLPPALVKKDYQKLMNMVGLDLYMRGEGKS